MNCQRHGRKQVQHTMPTRLSPIVNIRHFGQFRACFRTSNYALDSIYLELQQPNLPNQEEKKNPVSMAVIWSVMKKLVTTKVDYESKIFV